MFGRKKKQEPIWEMQTIYERARERLARMEADPDSFGISSEEEDLLADLRFTRDRMAALDPKSEEVKVLKARMESIDIELRAIKNKVPIEVQRDYVARLTDQKLAWEKEHLPRPMEKGQKWAVFMTGVGLTLPLIGEHFGRLWRHVSNRVDLPWRKIDK